jgi:hypothetical protein
MAESLILLAGCGPAAAAGGCPACRPAVAAPRARSLLALMLLVMLLAVLAGVISKPRSSGIDREDHARDQGAVSYFVPPRYCGACRIAFGF